MHRSLFFWAAAMLLAMAIYAMSIGPVFRPRGRAQQQPAGNTP
ncbi:MAG TPA: hypothetical protein VKG78_12765 [Opitutaceae bacterium]|nr:hypothetical protein [Opitutaceae bacterium]